MYNLMDSSFLLPSSIRGDHPELETLFFCTDKTCQHHSQRFIQSRLSQQEAAITQER